MKDARRYTVYGVDLESDFPFRNRLVAARGDRAFREPDLRFTVEHGEPHRVAGGPVFRSAASHTDGRSLIEVYSSGSAILVRYTDVADFVIESTSIDCRLVDPQFDFAVELYFLGLVFSIWLERRGVVALHASAVGLDGHAIGFLAGKESGKSSLSVGLMQLGGALLSDDLLALDVDGACMARPAFPEVRLWPDTANRFAGPDLVAPRAHPYYEKIQVPADRLGAFADSPQPLAALYLPQRVKKAGESEIRIEPLTPSEAFVELVRQSFCAAVLTSLGLDRHRFAAVSALARSVPVRRVVYPSGYDELSEVCRFLNRDAALHARRIAA